MDVAVDLSNAADALDRLVEREKQHKQAFRVAFDLLKEFYPPHNTEEWWEKYWAAIVVADAANNDNPLCRYLLLAITDYIDKEAKTGDAGPKNEK